MEERMRCRLAWIVVACAAVVLPRIAAADGLIIVDQPPSIVPGHYAFAPLQVTYHHVSVSINDLVATTTVDEEFYNPNGTRLEGTYLFPLPDGATIDRFSMEVGGAMVPAELLPADKARAIYEDIVRRMKDPALLEYASQGAFRLRVYPLEPRAGKRIRLSYTQILRSDAGITEYRYPLNTEKFSSAPVNDVSVKVTLDGTQPLKTVYCPSHPAEIRRDGDRRPFRRRAGRARTQGSPLLSPRYCLVLPCARRGDVRSRRLHAAGACRAQGTRRAVGANRSRS